MAKMSEKQKSKWLYAYDAVIRARLKGCRKQPTWQHLPAGHMRMAQGATPEKAAKEYLAETVFGRQACTKKKGR